MRILFLGDIMGRSGREAALDCLPKLKDKLKADVVIVNVDNAAGGHGVTMKIAKQFFDTGTDVLTAGNHVWNQRELLLSIDQEPRLLRPANYPQGTPGKGSYAHQLADGRKLLVIHLMGSLFMGDPLDSAFAEVERLLTNVRLGQNVDAVFIDMHAETTSERMAMAQYLDGRISALVGTHTHIPTCDEQIFDGGTAYQTDVGMCGDFGSVIGMKKETAIARFTKKLPLGRMEPADGKATVCGMFVDIDNKGRATHVEGFQFGGRLAPRNNPLKPYKK